MCPVNPLVLVEKLLILLTGAMYIFFASWILLKVFKNVTAQKNAVSIGAHPKKTVRLFFTKTNWQTFFIRFSYVPAR